MSAGMKAMTLHQPWASLIAEGVKTIETRGRRAPWSSAIGQTIAIHAAVRLPDSNGRLSGVPTFSAVDDYELFYSHPETLCARKIGDLVGFRLPLGAVVATCTLVDVVPMLAISDEPAPPDELDVLDDGRLLLWRSALPFDVTEQRPFGDYAPGRFALLLDNIVKLPNPVPARGFQGLWTFDAAALRVPAAEEPKQ